MIVLMRAAWWARASVCPSVCSSALSCNPLVVAGTAVPWQLLTRTAVSKLQVGFRDGRSTLSAFLLP